MKIKKILIGSLIALVIIGVIILFNYLFPVPMATIEVAAEPIFNIGPLVITNAFFTSLFLSLIILTLAFFVGRGLKEQPTGLQNIVEYMIESLDGLITSIAPKKWAATFFPIVITIFIYLLFANWFSLFTPLLGSFGFVHPAEHKGVSINKVFFITGGPETLHHESEVDTHEEAQESYGEASEPQVAIVPIFRAPSSDLNLTFALALITMTLVWVFGFREHGFFKYMSNFIRVTGFRKKGLMMWVIDFVIGIIEFMSEFAKIISFSFRLFGNIFAGEVVLIVISALVTLFLVVVFFILSLVFFSLATQHHGGEEH